MTCTASTAVALWTLHCLDGLIIHLPNTLRQGIGVLLRTGADGGDLFPRLYSPSVIHTYLHLHLWLQLVFTIPIAESEDVVIFCALRRFTRCLADIHHLLLYYLTASLFQPSPNQVSRLLAKLPHPCLSLTAPRHSFPHQRRGQTTKDGQTETQPRLCLTR